MTKEQILACLPPDHPWASTVEYHETIDSTNLRAKTLAAAGAPQGTVVIADGQTAGRGRLGRTFASPAGEGIYLSLILRPQCPPARLMHLTCATAVAACDGIWEATGYRPQIKWINDLVGGNKKLAGILTELSLDPTGNVAWAVVGIGINCDQTAFPEELRDIACSLSMVAGQHIDRAKLTAALIQAFHRMDLRDKAAIMDRYRRDCVTLGKQVLLIRGDQRREALALSLDDDGALTVRLPDGRTETVSSGEASVRGLFGYL
ncbi:MAG: biotin--[Oscillospiraceae bacterium]|nr:biotin--[acetyl-CoA-carboxylase] ligase [Oscillospiraceae bacterium]